MVNEERYLSVSFMPGLKCTATWELINVLEILTSE